MYDDSISHLSENFIRRILEVQETFLKHPVKQLITSLGTVDFSLEEVGLKWYDI